MRACAGELQPGTGAASPAAIARKLGVSERTLQRRFTEATGLRPGLYRRIARLQAAIRLHGATRPTLSALAYDAGYADQAHMTRDFVALTGLTPRALLADCASRAEE